MPYRRRGRAARRRARIIALTFALLIVALAGGLAWLARHHPPEIATRPEPSSSSGSSGGAPLPRDVGR
jgi:hypothetical protein